jgi:hypothetical protein
VSDRAKREDVIRSLAETALNWDLAALQAAAEAEARSRPGPWHWYCRLCGEKGEAVSEQERDDLARTHLDETPCGRHPVPGRASSGKLLHVWTYPASAAAELS